ncbi:MAG: tRNA epoxyqueuosine(34) reductase QueG [Spirochaetaceae bacterium]|nr:tRNA epoxyqueuosine(34) reductase QueG [Spirochaetaceae bacterium]
MVPGTAPQPDGGSAPPPNEAAFAPIARHCRDLGLTPCGVVAAQRDRRAEARYRRWLAAGRHGSMAYLERHAPFKANPAALLPGCRSVLMVALGYYQTPERGWIRPEAALRPCRPPAVGRSSVEDRVRAAALPASATAKSVAGAGSLTAAAPAGKQPGHGRVSGGPASHAAGHRVDGPRSTEIAPAPAPVRASAADGPGTRCAAADESRRVAGRVAQYAWGRDYHKLLRARLRSLVRRLAEQYPHERFRTGADATPLLESHHAVAAGVGFRGKHTLAINGEDGSWFFIGEVLTTLAIAPTPSRSRKRCGSGCSYCIDVCPTNAIVAPYQLDARRCISYLTIEHRGPVAEELREAIGDWLFGCDLCQEVCPWTVRARATAEPDLLHWRAGDALELAPLLELRTHDDLVARFAGSPLMRAGRDRLVRNACTVAGNRGTVELLPQLRRLMRDRDRGVAEHARWAVQRITGAAEPPAAGRPRP